MIIILGQLKLGEGAREAAQSAFEAMIAASLAEEGVIEYAFAIDVLDPSIMHVAEKYTDMDALSAHANSAHMATFRATLAELNVQIVNLMMYNADDGTKLM